MPDIDIDFADRSKALELFEHVVAVRKTESELVNHNTGIYVHNIPHNPVTSTSNIDYKLAEERGYFKIDFLNVGVYKGVKDEAHLISLMETDPLWDLLQQTEFVDLLFHLNGHAAILKKTRPSSVEQLAAVLAMIRPGKKHLIDKPWDDIMTEIWTAPANGDYYFKKAHAVAYAMAVVVQMNLICEQISYGYN